MNPWAGCPQVNSLDPSPGGAFSKADSGTDLSCVPAWGEGGMLVTADNRGELQSREGRIQSTHILANGG